MNVIAITQLYGGIKFQCSNCGMRFIRNQELKAHLDKHFHDNNEIRKKNKISQNDVPQNRPLFNTFSGWVNQGSKQDTNAGAKNDVAGAVAQGGRD